VDLGAEGFIGADRPEQLNFRLHIQAIMARHTG
jgi:hypothetical protein